MVETPTPFTIQAGRPEKSFATRQSPEVVRLSSQDILTNSDHSSLTNLSFSMRGPASRQTTSMPFWANSLESVPPPAPEPITTTTPSSLRSYFAAMGGDLAERTRSHWKLIRHFQIAGVPGRHEPDVGEINYPYLFDLIDSLGYDGWIGCEYRPRGKTLEGLGWANRYGIGG